MIFQAISSLLIHMSIGLKFVNKTVSYFAPQNACLTYLGHLGRHNTSRSNPICDTSPKLVNASKAGIFEVQNS
jgi:hypothetical protein